MKKAILVIMAAGMGSRYGGLKQLDPIDNEGNLIIDYSIFDAIKAGFSKVIFIIKEENYELFKEKIGDKVSKYIEVEYAFQKLDNLPNGFEVDKERVKPLGTGHAVLSCADKIDAPFAVINADDFYGADSFKKLYEFISTSSDDELYRFSMVGYKLFNTITENGYVSRGVCTTDENGFLTNIVERTQIEKINGKTCYTIEGEQFEIDENSIVSMNFWGFSQGFIKELEQKFIGFLQNELPKNPLKAEFFLPFVVNELIGENKATAKVLETSSKWYGVTYKEDKPNVVAAIEKMKQNGTYPLKLWE